MKTNEFIGMCCTCIKAELPAPNREINYAISHKFCRKGHATKAVSGLIDYLFSKTNIDHLIAIALIDNIASNKVINKCRFQSSGSVEIENESYNYYKIKKNSN